MQESKDSFSEQIHGAVKHIDSAEVCHPCMLDEMRCKATGWCEDCDELLCGECYKTHRKTKLTREHQLWSLTEMVVRKKRARVLNKCTKHEGEALKYFCEDHAVLGCGQCFVASHRNCTKVICISEMKTIETEEFVALETLLSNNDERLQRIQESAAENKQLSTGQHDKATTDVKESGQKLKSLIDKLVQEQIEKVEKAREEDLKNFMDIEGICVDVADKSKTGREMLTEGTEDNNQMFITMKYVQHEATIVESELEKAEKKNTIQEFEFVLNPELAAVLQKVTELGILRDVQLHRLEAGTDEVMEQMELRRFRTTKGWVWNNNGLPDAIKVTCSRDIRLLYVLIYPCYLRFSHVQVTVMEGNYCLLRCTSNLKNDTADLNVEVKNRDGSLGVILRAGQQYDIIVSILGGNSCYGEDGQAEITVGGVKFSFSDSLHSENCTNVKAGQIPGLKFEQI